MQGLAVSTEQTPPIYFIIKNLHKTPCLFRYPKQKSQILRFTHDIYFYIYERRRARLHGSVHSGFATREELLF
jgi:hypothetical protein